MIAARYGYTIDDFYRLTSRQLAALVPVIDNAKHKETELKAALQGRKLKPRPESVLNVTREEEKQQDKQAEELHNRLKQRFIQGKVNGA